MKRKSLTLVEIMVSVFILVVGIGTLFTVYPPLFEGVEVTFQTMRAWGECRNKIETLKNTLFDTLWNDKTPYVANRYGPETFIDLPKDIHLPRVMHGVFYLDKIPCTAAAGSHCVSGTLDDALKITVVVSVKAKNRVVGEDQNLNGSLDGTEDTNNNGILDSPISLTTIVIMK